MTDLISEVQRLRVADDEVLVVRPKGLLTECDAALLRRNLAKLADSMGWKMDRIVVLDRDVELTVVKAEQMELGEESA